jgi:arylsulfatase A-like enzyme
MNQTSTRRQFLVAGGTAVFTTLSPLACAFGRQVRKPNILLILADDLGYGDLGCYGQQRIRTPNLDRMASEGMQFTQYYAGSTVCAPSRCSLMTGKHTGNCTVRGNVDVLMRPEETTVAELLMRAGYATACIGKWGVGHPPDPEDPHRHGFDHFFGYLSMWHAHNYYPDFLWRNREKVPLDNVVQHPDRYYKEGQRELVGLAKEKRHYSHDLFTAEALKYIDAQDGPFFLYLPYTIPHANNEAHRFGEHGMEVPGLGRYAGEDWPEAEKGKAAMITRMDRDIGRLLDKLQQRGIDSNTLVIFTSDNGPHKEGGVDPAFFDSNGPLRGIKRDLYEGGIRVPMIARWPGRIEPGIESDHISAFWDILPTFAEIAGVEPPENIDGISLLPTLVGRAQREHEYLYWEFHERGPRQAVRMGKWKAVRMAPERPIELYDLDADIGEKNDIADRHPDVVARVRDVLRTAHTNDKKWPIKQQG